MLYLAIFVTVMAIIATVDLATEYTFRKEVKRMQAELDAFRRQADADFNRELAAIYKR